MNYCCDKFKEKFETYTGTPGRYPNECYPNSQFQFHEDDNVWVINGCCGGGCCVVVGMKYCPYCGTKLETLNEPIPISTAKAS